LKAYIPSNKKPAGAGSVVSAAIGAAGLSWAYSTWFRGAPLVFIGLVVILCLAAIAADLMQRHR
jgi:hypothetical protein